MAKTYYPIDYKKVQLDALKLMFKDGKRYPKIAKTEDHVEIILDGGAIYRFPDTLFKLATLNELSTITIDKVLPSLQNFKQCCITNERTEIIMNKKPVMLVKIKALDNSFNTYIDEKYLKYFDKYYLPDIVLYAENNLSVIAVTYEDVIIAGICPIKHQD